MDQIDKWPDCWTEGPYDSRYVHVDCRTLMRLSVLIKARSYLDRLLQRSIQSMIDRAEEKSQSR